MIGLHATLAASRFVYDAAVMFIFGSNSFVCLAAPRTLESTIMRRLETPMLTAASLAAAAMLIWLPLQAAMIGGGWEHVFDTSIMFVLLDHTTVGHVWDARALLAMLLIIAAAALRPSPPLLILLSAGAIISLALAGHAMMDEGMRAVVHVVNHAVHVLAAAAWVGSLVPVLICLAALRNPAQHDKAALALRRFSIMGHIAVALVVGTGAIDMVLVLGGLPVHWASPYQVLLTIKIALVAVMIVLALVNGYVSMPGIESGKDATIESMQRQTIAELALAVCVIALVAVFGLLDPMP
ncbi:MAG TPA: copper homeostasis membrane protein CopD [Bradyrhizobium sp.]